MILCEDFFSDLAKLCEVEAVPLLRLKRVESLGDGFFWTSGRDWAEFLEEAAVRFRHPDFGMRWAMRGNGLPSDDIFALALRNCRTLEDALNQAVNVTERLDSCYQLKYRSHQHSNFGALEFDMLLDSSAPTRQAIEFCMAIFYRSLSQAFNRDISCQMLFSHAPLSPHAVYQRHLPTMLKFHQPCNAIRFQYRDLTKPIPGRSEALFMLANYYIANKFPKRNLGIRPDVERIAGRLLSEGRCTLEAVAAELALHPRTLQRRLRDEATSFAAVRDEAQRDLAKSLLSNHEVSFSEIASRLGYSDSAAFTRSCHRWFSSSPRKLRVTLSHSGGHRSAVDPANGK
jgi:AraC-like DNA-binding protein